MFGSLSEFMHTQESEKQEILVKQMTPVKSFSEEKYNRKPLPVYETQDKSMILGLVQYKVHRQKMAQDLLKEAMQVKPEPLKTDKQHWVELNLNKQHPNSKLKHKHRLLRAVVKRKQIESQDHSKSLYEKSICRVISAYKKIRTQPTDIFFTPKMMEQLNSQSSQSLPQDRQKMNTISPSRLLSLQDSVRWAKKHGKDLKNLYGELGKSVQLISQQRSNKSNYQLQKQQKVKQEEEIRRSCRKKFLKQIKYRITRHSLPNQAEYFGQL